MNRALFLDRDGTINEMVGNRDYSSTSGKPMDDSPRELAELSFVPGIRSLIGVGRKLGYKPIVITNQPSIVKGTCTMANYEAITREICKVLELNRNDIFDCFHKGGEYSMDCDCRKPRPGMFYMAKGVHDIALEQSIMIGDSWKDIAAAKAAGVGKAIFIERPKTDTHIGNDDSKERMNSIGISPDYVIKSLWEAIDIIKKAQPDLSLGKLELGCGAKPTPGYLHQDITRQEGVKLDFVCDPWEIPLKENSLNEVLALGLMEHLRYAEFDSTLRHMHHILAPKGSFLFDVPDMKVWSEYLYNLTHGMPEKNPFRPEHIWATMFGWQRWPGDEHKSGWTRDTLVEKVKSAGFSGIEEGVQIFTSKGIQRGRFTRDGDAHIYIKATK